MYTYSLSKRPWPPILVALVITVLVDQCWISPLFPEWSRVAGISPGVVFLDCPVNLPFPSGLPALGIFLLVYSLLIFPYPSLMKGKAWEAAKKQVRTVTLALAILPISLLAGGLGYFFAHDYLSRPVRNAIESFGIDADLYTAYPGHEVIHLRGSMPMLLCFIIGLQLCKRKIRKAFPLADPGPGRRTVPDIDTQVCTYTDPTQAPAPVRLRQDPSRKLAGLTPPVPEFRRSVHDLYREEAAPPAQAGRIPATTMAVPQMQLPTGDTAHSLPETPRNLPKRVHVILPQARSY